MRMSVLTNKRKIIRYFIKNGIFNEERAIEISKFDHNTIEAFVHSQLLVQVDGRVYLLDICVSCILFRNRIV